MAKEIQSNMDVASELISEHELIACTPRPEQSKSGLLFAQPHCAVAIDTKAATTAASNASMVPAVSVESMSTNSTHMR